MVCPNIRIVILQIIIFNPLIYHSFKSNNLKDYYNHLYPSHSSSFQYSHSFLLYILPTKHSLRENEFLIRFKRVLKTHSHILGKMDPLYQLTRFFIKMGTGSGEDLFLQLSSKLGLKSVSIIGFLAFF